jgi:ribosomal protein S27AE
LFILRGVYNLGRKIVAYRNDVCLTCAAPRRIYGLRAFRIFHIFFVPLIPLGFSRIWRCSVCKLDPRLNTGAEIGGAWLWCIFFGIISVTGWLDAQSYPMQALFFLAYIWLVFLFLLWQAVSITRRYRSIPVFVLEHKLRELKPADEKFCPFCGSAFMDGHRVFCSHCGVERVQAV